MNMNILFHSMQVITRVKKPNSTGFGPWNSKGHRWAARVPCGICGRTTCPSQARAGDRGHMMTLPREEPGHSEFLLRATHNVNIRWRTWTQGTGAGLAPTPSSGTTTAANPAWCPKDLPANRGWGVGAPVPANKNGIKT